MITVTLPCFLPFSLNYSGMCLASDAQFSDFLDGMGPAQFVGRQTLATTSLGEYIYTSDNLCYLTSSCTTGTLKMPPFLLCKNRQMLKWLVIVRASCQKVVC